MIIPPESLEAETLHAIIESFVLQEGTEYGEQEVALNDKVEEVKQQLRDKRALLVFSELHQNVNIIPADQYSQM